MTRTPLWNYNDPDSGTPRVINLARCVEAGIDAVAHSDLPDTQIGWELAVHTHGGTRFVLDRRLTSDRIDEAEIDEGIEIEASEASLLNLAELEVELDAVQEHLGRDE